MQKHSVTIMIMRMLYMTRERRMRNVRETVHHQLIFSRLAVFNEIRSDEVASDWSRNCTRPLWRLLVISGNQ